MIIWFSEAYAGGRDCGMLLEITDKNSKKKFEYLAARIRTTLLLLLRCCLADEHASDLHGQIWIIEEFQCFFMRPFRDGHKRSDNAFEGGRRFDFFSPGKECLEDFVMTHFSHKQRNR